MAEDTIKKDAENLLDKDTLSFAGHGEVSKAGSIDDILKRMRQFSHRIDVIRVYMQIVNPAIREKTNAELVVVEPIIKAMVEMIDSQKKKAGRKTVKLELDLPEAIDAKGVVKKLKDFTKIIDIPSHLTETSLVSLISQCEIFISAHLHSHYRMHPKSLKKTEVNKFSLSELETFQTIEDARASLIQNEVERIIRSKFSDWIDVLEELGYECEFIQANKEKISEFFQRRNLIVHNAGIVNNQYLKATNKPHKEKLGERLKVDRKYLAEAFDYCEAGFCLISLEAIKRQLKGSNAASQEEAYEHINTIIFEHVQEKRYVIAEHLSKYVIDKMPLSKALLFVAKVNYWQSLKWQNRLSEVEEKIKKEDISGMQLRYHIARLALLDNFEEFFKLLPRAIKEKELRHEELEEWPLFQRVRERKEFGAYNKARQASKRVKRGAARKRLKISRG